MAKLIRIDEFGTYLTSDNLFNGCNDWDQEVGTTRTEEEYITPSDSLLEGL